MWSVGWGSPRAWRPQAIRDRGWGRGWEEGEGTLLAKERRVRAGWEWGERDDRKAAAISVQGGRMIGMERRSLSSMGRESPGVCWEWSIARCKRCCCPLAIPCDSPTDQRSSLRAVVAALAWRWALKGINPKPPLGGLPPNIEQGIPGALCLCLGGASNPSSAAMVAWVAGDWCEGLSIRSTRAYIAFSSERRRGSGMPLCSAAKEILLSAYPKPAAPRPKVDKPRCATLDIALWTSCKSVGQPLGGGEGVVESFEKVTPRDWVVLTTGRPSTW